MRILEAQKTIMCSFLHDQQKNHGMAYIVIVWNEAGDVFTRVRIDTDEQMLEMLPAVELVREAFDNRGDGVHLERSKIRKEG